MDHPDIMIPAEVEIAGQSGFNSTRTDTKSLVYISDEYAGARSRFNFMRYKNKPDIFIDLLTSNRKSRTFRPETARDKFTLQGADAVIVAKYLGIGSYSSIPKVDINANSLHLLPGSSLGEGSNRVDITTHDDIEQGKGSTMYVSKVICHSYINNARGENIGPASLGAEIQCAREFKGNKPPVDSVTVIDATSHDAIGQRAAIAQVAHEVGPVLAAGKASAAIGEQSERRGVQGSSRTGETRTDSQAGLEALLAERFTPQTEIVNSDSGSTTRVYTLDIDRYAPTEDSMSDLTQLMGLTAATGWGHVSSVSTDGSFGKTRVILTFQKS